MGDNGGWLSLLGGGAITAAIGILYWILRRTDRALERSNTAIQQTNRNMAFTGQNMALVEALRQAIFMQGNGLDQWEDWGVDVQRSNRRMQQQLVDQGSLDHVEELPAPPKHIDLGPIFRNLPAFGADSASGDDAPEQPEEKFFDRFLGNR